MDDAGALTVAILTYNAVEKLRGCLRSVRTHLPACPVIVWDNASADDTTRMVREEFPEVELVASRENLFYAEGCNQLVLRARSAYVLLMNADVVLEDAGIAEVVAHLEAHEELIAASPAVEDAGRVRHLAHVAVTPALAIARDSALGKVLRRTQWYAEAMFHDVRPDDVFPAPKITNCCCVVRRERFLALGGFAPGQLLYCTEEDFALRAAAAGYRQAVYGKCKVRHDHGTSTATLPYGLLRAIVVRDRMAYTRRHFGAAAAALVELAIFLRPKIWHSVYDWCCLIRHRRTMGRAARRAAQQHGAWMARGVGRRVSTVESRPACGG